MNRNHNTKRFLTLAAAIFCATTLSAHAQIQNNKPAITLATSAAVQGPINSGNSYLQFPYRSH